MPLPLLRILRPRASPSVSLPECAAAVLQVTLQLARLNELCAGKLDSLNYDRMRTEYRDEYNARLSDKLNCDLSPAPPRRVTVHRVFRARTVLPQTRTLLPRTLTFPASLPVPSCLVHAPSALSRTPPPPLLPTAALIGRPLPGRRR